MIQNFCVYPISDAIISNDKSLRIKVSIPDNLPESIQMVHWKTSVGSFYRLSTEQENHPLEETEENYELWVKPFYEQWLAEQPKVIQERMTFLIQDVLDKEAQKLGYDNCLSVCSYVDTGVTKFDDEGKSFRAWRSAVWAKGYEILDEVVSGKREIPTEEELLAELPTLEIVYSEGVV